MKNLKKEYPILEFDENKVAFINPDFRCYEKLKDIDNKCHKILICYFKEVIQKLLEEKRIELYFSLDSETVDLHIYKYVDYDICITQGQLGAPSMAGFLEELIAVGFNVILCSGGAGVLRKDLQVGKLILVDEAIRAEGLSYHYIAPSRTIKANQEFVSFIKKELDNKNVPYICGKTWTTDAFYRETKDIIELRKEEGAICVEMEQSAIFAVAEFRHITYGALLYGGDDLSSDEWDSRSWRNRSDIRYQLIELIKDIINNY